VMIADRTGYDTSRRRFGRSSAAGIALAGAAFSWLVTGGTFQFFKSVPFSNFYDVQARALMRGTWSMPASVLSIDSPTAARSSRPEARATGSKTPRPGHAGPSRSHLWTRLRPPGNF
jgi:hypothetical protein